MNRSRMYRLTFKAEVKPATSAYLTHPISNRCFAAHGSAEVERSCRIFFGTWTVVATFCTVKTVVPASGGESSKVPQRMGVYSAGCFYIIRSAFNFSTGETKLTSHRIICHIHLKAASTARSTIMNARSVYFGGTLTACPVYDENTTAIVTTRLVSIFRSIGKISAVNVMQHISHNNHRITAKFETLWVG